MSVAPRHPTVAGLSGLRMNAEQFFLHGETADRLELVDGVVCVSPSATPAHQRLLEEVLLQFADQRRAGLPIATFLDTDVQFGEAIVYRPDLSVYAKAKVPKTPKRLTLPPD